MAGARRTSSSKCSVFAVLLARKPGQARSETGSSAGVAVFVTPNRLTFARPDEIIDPYHYREYDPRQLRALCETAFAAVELRGLFGSARYASLVGEERVRLDQLLARDPFRLRRLVPRRVRQRLYDRMADSLRYDEVLVSEHDILDGVALALAQKA